MYATGAKIPARAVRYVFSLLDTTWYRCNWGVGHVSQERVVARRVRSDLRWDADVGYGGEQPGSIAREGRSLAIDQPWATHAFPGGEAQRDADMR
jgi:hypothetical protein